MGAGTRFSIKMSNFVSNSCDVAHLSMLIRDVIRRGAHRVDGPFWLLRLTIGHVQALVIGAPRVNHVDSHRHVNHCTS